MQELQVERFRGSELLVGSSFRVYIDPANLPCQPGRIFMEVELKKPQRAQKSLHDQTCVLFWPGMGYTTDT